MGHFELFQDKKGEYRFRLRASNGEIIAVGEGYKAKAGCLNGIESIKRNATMAEIKELSSDEDSVVGRPLKAPVFEMFKDHAGEFRFRLIAANGEIIAVGEGYNRKEGCLNGIDSIKRNAPTSDIKDLITDTVIEGVKIPTETVEEKEEAVEERAEEVATTEPEEEIKEDIETKEKVKEIPEKVPIKKTPAVEEVSKEEDNKRPIIAVVSAIVGGIIGYLVANTVNPLLGLILAILVGGIIGFGVGWQLAKESNAKTVIAAGTGFIGIVLSIIVATRAPVSIGVLLAVIVGALFGLLIAVERIIKEGD